MQTVWKTALLAEDNKGGEQTPTRVEIRRRAREDREVGRKIKKTTFLRAVFTQETGIAAAVHQDRCRCIQEGIEPVEQMAEQVSRTVMGMSSFFLQPCRMQVVRRETLAWKKTWATIETS